MAKRRYFHTELVGEPFIFDSGLHEKPQFTRWNYSNIFSAYDRPSQTKIAIWEYWKRWLTDLQLSLVTGDDFEMWIDSRNGFKFTITGYCYDNICKQYVCFHITKSKNVFWIAR